MFGCEGIQWRHTLQPSLCNKAAPLCERRQRNGKWFYGAIIKPDDYEVRKEITLKFRVVAGNRLKNGSAVFQKTAFTVRQQKISLFIIETVFLQPLI
jgi:hypothetical protein